MVVQVATLHVRFNGRSVEVPLEELDVGRFNSDEQIIKAAAKYLNVPFRQFDYYVVDRHEGGDMTIRPDAFFS